MPQDYKPGHIDPFWSPEDKAAMTRVNGELSSRAASAAARESRENWADQKRQESKSAIGMQAKATGERAAEARALESRGRQTQKDWSKKAEPPRALKKAPPPRRDPERSR